MSGFDCRCGHSWVSHYVDWPRACSRCECQALSRAAMPPAPPSALSGVSAEELRELARWLSDSLSHYSCEDNWYSCPMSPEGCADDGQGKECNCGIEDKHKQFDRAASILRALAESMEGGKG